MEKENLDDYEIFYLELPQADYLKDIEIQDDFDPRDYDEAQGLSPDQVRQIAQDSLDAAGARGSSQAETTEPELFNNESPAQ